MASTSMLASGAAASYLSAPGAAPDVVILSGGGRVPETGAVDLGSLRNATAVPGVLASSAEVYAPVVVDGRVAVVRGVNLTGFASVQGAPLGGGAPFGGGAVYVGEGFAREFGVGAGSSMLLRGVLANFSTEVTVAAVVAPGQPYDGEVISSIHLAQELRGLSGSQVTFLRLKVDPAAFNGTRLLQAIGVRPGGPGAPAGSPVIQQLQLAPTASLLSIFAPGGPPPSVSSVLARGVGVVQATFESLEGVVLVVSALAVYFATAYWLESVRRTRDTLAALGMDRRTELLWLLSAAVPPSLLAGAAGFLAAYVGLAALSGGGSLMFFFQPVPVPLDPVAAALSSVGPASAVAASIVVRSVSPDARPRAHA
jgi:hypothetical protein